MSRRREVFAERFTIERLAAVGGTGQIYLARDRGSDRLVALKVIRDGGKLEIGRFAREAQILATLSHPGIVRFIDSGITVEGEPYLAMEWLSGETLAARLQRTRLTLAEVFCLGRRVASALGAIHRHGVVHRDIKPSNLFLRDGAIDRVALIDFGIARRPLTDPNLTVTYTMLSTPGYIAPEQLQNLANLDGRGDIFSLGCVLYRCVSGQAPFRGPEALRMLLNGTPEQLPRLHRFRPSIPRGLDDLVARMLSRSPDDRPPHGDQVASELLAIEENELPAPARSEPPGGLSEILAAERRLMCLVLARRPEASAQDHAIHEVVEHHRGKLEVLDDSSVLAIVFSSADAATDLASRAARCALSLQRLLGPGSLAVVTGRGVPGHGVLERELLDRAEDLIEASANQPTICIDEPTSGLLRDRFDTGSTGRHLRGKLRQPDRMRLVFGEPSPCMGRELEIDQLDSIFAQCADERVASMVLLSGPPGVGKSRLAHEFLRRLEARGRAVETWFARGDALNASAAFDLLAQLVRCALGVLDGEPMEVRREKLRAWVARDPTRADLGVAEVIGELVGAPLDSKDDSARGAEEWSTALPSEEIARAFQRFLRAGCAAQPVVIVLEDLQWGGLSTIRLIYTAFRALADQPLMVLALARPCIHDLSPQLWADHCVQEIRMHKLTRRASAQLVRQALGDTVTYETLEALVRRSGRHVSYLDELIRAEAEGKGTTTPQTVLAMVQAQIEKLDPEARRVLRAASLFGKTFRSESIESLLGGEDIAAWIAVLAEQGMIEVQDDGRFSAEVEYGFPYVLIQEAAHEMLTRDDRTLGHRLAEQWLEQTTRPT